MAENALWRAICELYDGVDEFTFFAGFQTIQFSGRDPVRVSATTSELSQLVSMGGIALLSQSAFSSTCMILPQTRIALSAIRSVTGLPKPPGLPTPPAWNAQSKPLAPPQKKLKPPPEPPEPDKGPCVFIGHGRSKAWLELLPMFSKWGVRYDEFDQKDTLGRQVQTRLKEMLDECSLAILVLTAEDEHQDGSLHPRENVIHEAGLCAGRYGTDKTILMVEEGCQLFSNTAGLIYLPFRRGAMRDKAQDLYQFLKQKCAVTTP